MSSPARILLTLTLFAAAFTAGSAVAQSKLWAAGLIQDQLLTDGIRHEIRATLDPGLFQKNRMVEAAYRAARDHPAILDKVYCYCHCALNDRFRHKSLLTCFVDDHGANCGVCMRQALESVARAAKGWSAEKIAASFAEEYRIKQGG